ncbi:hypothetical protein ACET3Z_014776 [Daucus carota]
MKIPAIYVTLLFLLAMYTGNVLVAADCTTHYSEPGGAKCDAGACRSKCSGAFRGGKGRCELIDTCVCHHPC